MEEFQFIPSLGSICTAFSMAYRAMKFFILSSTLLNMLLGFYHKINSSSFFSTDICTMCKRKLALCVGSCGVIFSRFSWKNYRRSNRKSIMLLQHADLLKDNQQRFYMKMHLICINNMYGWKGCTLYATESKFLVVYIIACCAHQIELALSDLVKNGA